MSWSCSVTSSIASHSGVTAGSLGVAFESVQARLRPVQARPVERIAELARRAYGLGEQPARPLERAGVDERVRQNNREAEVQNRVAGLLGGAQAPLEDVDGALGVARDRICAAETVRERGPGRHVRVEQRQRLLEMLDGRLRLAPSQGELPETLRGARLQARVAALLERRAQETLGDVHLVHAQGYLRLDQPLLRLGDGPAPRGEVVGVDVEPAAELAQQLQRGDPAPASIREMYAGVQPRKESCRWLARRTDQAST